ncbi:BQ5605_C026g10228 [Microbotryum silenes-dioicae]|uniref:galacturonan 1,4-alpha-galacturonidase n=1 Tax=Microbotryum silenes-dioicae TaxID=796604 RepID=A0A2X0PGD0_9BASI|nr:BQ5605_C026g10228 [Microbotryum silenes-dioicae]
MFVRYRSLSFVRSAGVSLAHVAVVHLSGDDKDHRTKCPGARPLLLRPRCTGLTTTSKAEKPSTFNGNGQKWWDQFVKDKKAGNLHGIESTEYARPILLTIGNTKNVRVENINFLNGPFWNIFITHSKQVTMSNINIAAVSKSDSLPYNSDGVDIYNSDDVTLLDFNLNNADDCVSLKPNSTNVEVSHMNCNGSHGILVGSLGQYVDSYNVVSQPGGVDCSPSKSSWSRALNGLNIFISSRIDTRRPLDSWIETRERHEIALEPHWFRVQTERIKRCNSQAKKDY